MSFEDHFAKAGGYSTHRPTYPPELFHWLAQQCAHRELAWDCATGGGQAAQDLTEYFSRIVATDASPAQLAQAAVHPAIEYRQATAEESGLEEQSVDLVTVAQAYHWFDHPAFLEEVSRVLRPAGVLAVWTYNLLEISEEVDALVRHYYDEVVYDYWPQRRRHVESGYRDLPFPKPLLAAPALAMQADWSPRSLLGYLGTWSATQRYRQARGQDPLEEMGERLLAIWPDGKRPVRWPLTLLATRF